MTDLVPEAAIAKVFTVLVQLQGPETARQIAIRRAKAGGSPATQEAWQRIASLCDTVLHAS